MDILITLYSFAKNYKFCAIKHFYLMNDKNINVRKVARFLGEAKKKNVDRCYTDAEIKVY